MHCGCFFTTHAVGYTASLDGFGEGQLAWIADTYLARDERVDGDSNCTNDVILEKEK